MAKNKKESSSTADGLLLIHPVLGKRITDLTHAKSIMDMKDNGGWKWINPPKATEDGNSTGVQGQDGESKESKSDSEGDSTRAES